MNSPSQLSRDAPIFNPALDQQRYQQSRGHVPAPPINMNKQPPLPPHPQDSHFSHYGNPRIYSNSLIVFKKELLHFYFYFFTAHLCMASTCEVL